MYGSIHHHTKIENICKSKFNYVNIISSSHLRKDISCFNLQRKISKKLQHITSYPSNIKQYDTVWKKSIQTCQNICLLSPILSWQSGQFFIPSAQVIHITKWRQSIRQSEYAFLQIKQAEKRSDNISFNQKRI